MAERIELTEQKMAAGCMAFKSCPLPAEVLRAAEDVILDWLGCVLAGACDRPAQIIAQVHADEIGHGPATCFVGPALCQPGLAAVIAGTAAHTAELDDIYSPALYHPGAAVISAALAASQEAGASGELFMRAVIAGYELSNRLGTAINPQHYRFWHTTGTVGALGAACAAAVALGLSEEETRSALANAASMAAGLQQAFRSDGMTKPLHAGRAAESGLLAARLAKAGFVGARAMISGPVGLVSAMSHGGDIHHAFDDLLREWTITRSTYKRFSACGHTFAPVDAAIWLRQEAAIDVGEVASIEVATYEVAIDAAGIREPKSPFEAKFSIAFGVAATLCGRDPTDPAVYDRCFEDPDVCDLMARVTLSADPEITAAFPQLRGARVTVALKNGRSVSHAMPTRKGEPSNPLSRDELEAKFRRLVGATRHKARATALVEWVQALAHGAGVGPADLPLVGNETQSQAAE